MTVDLLEQRLHEMEVEAPDAGRVSAKVLGRQTRRSSRRLPRLVTVPLALALLVVLIAYFAPAADLAMASKVPWSGELLQWAGLVGATDRITSVNASATSSGYRLTMTGAYADSTRTVLLMHAEPGIAAVWFPSLTDQFGRSYHSTGGVSNMLTGDFEMDFEPMAWPDSITGARMTVHIDDLETPSQDHVTGSWELTAALPVDQGSALPAPAPGSLGPAHVRFVSARYTPATVAVVIEVTGATPDELSRLVPNGAKGQPALTIEILDATGDLVGGGSGGPNPIQVLGYRTGGNKYVVRVSYYGYGSFDRVLTIPA